jgi:hypothetical protein
MEYFQKRCEFSCDDSLRMDRGFSYNSQVLESPQLLAGHARLATKNPDSKLGRGEWE